MTGISAATIKILADISDVQRKFESVGRSAGQTSGQVGRSFDGATQRMARMGEEANSIRGAMGGLKGAAMQAAGALAGMLSVAAFVRTADAVTLLRNNLMLASGSAEKATQAYYALFEIAQRSRVGFVELGTTFASISRASESLGLTQQQMLTVTESIANAVTISGASAQAAQAALMQLGQGLASGVLRGEELNSIMEQTPRVARALADGLGVPIGALRALGEQGKLTADVVIAALTSQAEVLAREVENGVVTIGQAFTQTMNSATLLLGEIDRVTGMSSQMAVELQGAADALGDVAMAFRDVESAGRPVSLLGDALRVVFETLAIIGANVAFVFRTIGQDFGASMAMIHAGINGPLQGAWTRMMEIRQMRLADAREARTEVDALTARLADSAAAAEQARAAQQKQTRDRAAEAAASGAQAREALARAQGGAAGAQRAAGAAKQAVDEVARSAERGLRIVSDMTAQQSGITSQYVTQLADLDRAVARGLVTMEQRGAALAHLLQQQPVAREQAQQLAAAIKEQAEAQSALARADQDRIAALESSAQQVEQALDRMRDEERAAAMAAQQNIGLAEAIEEVAIARLRERQAALQRAGEHSGDVVAIEREISARRDLIAVTNQREAREANARAAQEAAQQWERTTGIIEESLTDALMRGFESGKGFARNLRDTVVNMFRTMVLRPIIQAVVAPVAAVVTGALGFGGAAHAAGQASDAIGMASGIRGVYDTIMGGFTALGNRVAFAAHDIGNWLVHNTTGVLNSAGGTLMQSASSLGTVASNLAGIGAGLGLGNLISGQFAAFGNANVSTMAGTAIGAIFGGPIGAAIGGAIGGLVNRAFGRRPVQTTGTGISGTLSTTGANVQQFQDWHQRGGWFRSDRGGTNYSPVSSGLAQFLDGAVQQIAGATRAYAGILGLNADAINGITQTVRISLQGLNAEQQQQAIMAAMQGFADRLAQAYANPFVRAGETAGAALARLGSSLATVNQVLDTLNGTLLQTSLAGGDAASQLIDLFGGAEAFVRATSAYYQAFYTEAERAAKATEQITAALASMGMAMPATRAQFRALVDAQDLTTTAGRQTYAALMQLAPAFAQITAAADDLTARFGRLVASAINDALRAVDQQIAQSKTAADAARDAARAYGDAAADLRATVERLRGTQNTPQGAQAAYTQALGLARGGDVSAMQALPQLAEAYAYQARSMASTSAQASIISARIAAELAQVAAVADVMEIGANYQAKLFDVNTAILEVLKTELESGNLTVELLGEIRGALGHMSALISDSSRSTVAVIRTMDGNTAIGLQDNAGRVIGQLSAGTALALQGMHNQTGSLGNQFSSSITGQTVAFSGLGQAQIRHLQGVEGLQADTLGVTEISTMSTQGSQMLLNAVLAQLKAPDASAFLIADRIVGGNTLIAGRLDLVVAAINQQSAAQQAELRRQQDLARAHADLDAIAQTRRMVVSQVEQGIAGIWELARQHGVFLNAEIGPFLRAHTATFRVNEQGLFEGRYNQITGSNWEPFRNAFWSPGGVHAQTYGRAAELQALADQLAAQRQRILDLGGTPAFAAGGLHAGGLRLVGEHGPELEATGPSRIYSASQTAAILGGGGDVAQEVRALREELGLLRAEARATASNTGKTKRLLERVTRDGEAMQTVGAAP